MAYLSAEPKEKAKAALANTQGVLEMYRVKEEQKRSVELRYKPFSPLGDAEHSISHRVQVIQGIISTKDYERAISMSHELLDLGLKGLRYLQTYDWLFLRTLVTAGYLGWIVFAITTVIDMHVLHGKTAAVRTLTTSSSFGAIGAVLFSTLLIRKAPITYYLYAVFPLAFWEEVASQRQTIYLGFDVLLRAMDAKHGFLIEGIQALAFVGVLEALVTKYYILSLPVC